MSDTLATTIEAANEVLLVAGEGRAADRYFTPDYLVHVTEHDLRSGPAGVRTWVETLWKTFTDLEVNVEILAEVGDRVAWQRTLSGMMTGSFKGFPATGRRVVWRDMVVSRFQDGRIAEDWVVTDLAERLLVGRKG